ncbi:MAG TPA: hypothetical protein VGF46_07540 [Gaiellales bacterium]
MPEVRAGNASVHARGDETLGAVQSAAARHGQWLPVDAPDTLTIAELCARRDGGPREARYGPFRAHVLSLSAGGLRFGSEAVKNVAGYDIRRAWLGAIDVELAALRLAALPAWRRDALVRGGDAFALAESLRALASAPAAIVVLSPDLLAISDDAPSSEIARRELDLVTVAARAGATIEPIGRDAWNDRCATLPRGRLRIAGRDARDLLPALDVVWAYDAGRRLALAPTSALAAIRPRRDPPPPAAALVERVREALAP